MPNYTKLFNSIVTSTIWTEDDKTRILWITMLAMADQNGEVHASIPGLARIAGIDIESTEKALNAFLSPDPYSRTPDNEGRRIVKIDGGWELLNHPKYRRMASKEDSKEATAARVKRHRERNATVTPCNATVTVCNAIVTVRNGGVTDGRDIAEAEAEAKAEAKADAEGDKTENEERELNTLRCSLSSSDVDCIAKINSVSRGWANLPVLSAKELSAYAINREMLKAVPEATWGAIRGYYAASLPEGKPAHRPRSRERFIADLPDIAEYADQWERTRPKAKQKSKVIEYSGEALTPEEIAAWIEETKKKPA